MNAMQNQTGTILIVDDNPTNLGVLFSSLTQVGFKVLVAEDGEKALAQVERTQPHVILLDILMPGIDGFETCHRLKRLEASAEIPVIFMTALSDTVDKIKGFEAGGVDYITKPFQQEEVLARVKAHLTIRQLQQQLQQQNDLLARQNELLAEKNTQLEALNVSKDKFFSIIAHDLRSPFTGFLGLTQFIVENIEEWEREKIKDITTKLHESAENLYALLGNLLTWSRIQRGIIEYEPQPFNLTTIVARNIELFTRNARQKQITLTQDLAAHLAVYADVQMIDTVVRNLLSNALKFTQPGGAITVSAIVRETDVQISVSDTGIGIPDKQIPNLFRIDT
jgi:two-component system sensor histidine kinase/response regulator